MNEQERRKNLDAALKPWLPRWAPQPGRLARARLGSPEDVAAIERYRPADLLPAATLYDCLHAAALAAPDKPAMIALSSPDLAVAPRVLTYADLMTAITRAANLFHDLAEKEKPSVAILLPMVPEGLICAFAAATCGVATSINPFLESHHVAGLMRASATNVLVATDDIAAKLHALKDQVPTLRHVLLLDAAAPARDFAAAAARCRGDALDVTPTAPGDTVVHMPTGGTTAAPKLARLNHFSLLTVAWSVGALMGPAEDGVVGHAMPNFHIGGTCTLGLRTLLYGQTLLTLTRDGFRNRGVVENFWDIARHYKMTSVLATPTTASAILANSRTEAGAHRLEDFHCGGSTVPIALMRGFHDRFGVWLRENWGMTEAHGTMTGHPSDGREPVIGSVGITLPFFKTKAIEVDERNAFVRECAPGERGVLALGGPTIITGYVDPALDAGYLVSGMPDGARWGNTGDVGAIDERGYVWLFGRAKDVIIRGGHNIDPKPIEEVIAQFPGVQLAAMVGKPDAVKGELPVAYVQPTPGAVLDTAALLAFCAEGAHERAGLPTEIIFVEAMPLTAIGKIAKPALKIDILRRTVEQIARRELGEISFEITLEASGRRPKAIIDVTAAPGEALSALRRTLEGYEFDAEVRVA